MQAGSQSFPEDRSLNGVQRDSEASFRLCENRCVFCFIDQLPSGLRGSLYLKDGDYRLSPLFGNFVTLTNVSQEELEKIVDLELSPMYVSVHCTDPERRKALLGHKDAGKILEQLETLGKGRVELHIQIVLCPNWNDGEVFKSTLEALLSLSVPPLSVGVVPVGLPAHREGLTPMKSVTSRGAKDALNTIREFQARCRRLLGRNWVYAADELFLLSGEPFPEGELYDGFWQVENGVGMVRAFMDSARGEMSNRIPGRDACRQAIATGTDFAPILERILAEWKEDLSVKVIPVPSLLLGGGVTVAGLMAGEDVLSQAEAMEGVNTLLLPGSCVREEEPRLFLDDWELTPLADKLGVNIQVVSPSGDSLIRVLAGVPEPGDVEQEVVPANFRRKENW